MLLDTNDFMVNHQEDEEANVNQINELMEKCDANGDG